MTHEDLEKYARLMMSMCTDFLMGGITDETFHGNTVIIGQAFEEKAPATPERRSA